jgi:hypothetical protein
MGCPYRKGPAYQTAPAASRIRAMTIFSFSFHNFDFAPGKDFVQKKSQRLLLREAVQRAGNTKPRSGATSL